jgi:hypothetical protein
MRPEDRLLFICTRQNFLEAHQQAAFDVCRQHEIRWDVVYRTADLHGVAPLVYVNLQRCLARDLRIPPAIINQFKQGTMRNMLAKEGMARNISRAISYFGERSIPVMLIKGGALDVLAYDHAWYTMALDADIVIGRRRTEVSAQERKQFEKFFRGSAIEYDYFEHHDVVMNGALPIDFQRIWDDAASIEYRGQDVLVMSPEDMLLSVCINSCRKRFFRLKSLCDIAETISRYPHLGWGELADKARAYDCSNIVYAALLVTKKTLGCNLPDEVFDELTVSPFRGAIMRLLIHHLKQRLPLTALYPFSGRKVFGRELTWSLILPYATYNGYQMGRKMREVYRAWQVQN